MWWTQQQSFTLVKRQARTGVSRTVTASADGNVQRSCEAKRAGFRQLDLTAEAHLANRILAESHGDTRCENEILLADIRALELALQKANQFQHQQAAEVSRLRAECDRWLSETYLLSEQLAKQNRELAKTSAAPTASKREAWATANGVLQQSVVEAGNLENPDNGSDESVKSSHRRAA